MSLRDNGGIEHRKHPGFDAENTTASIAELEQQYERGEISRERYLEKKQALVSIFMKATTNSSRHRKRRYETEI